MVSPAAAPSAGLDALLARPPTPPRERQSDLDQKLALDQHPLASCLTTLQTPPSHSPDSALSTNASLRRSRKRVEFTVQADYCDPPVDVGKENRHKKSTPIVTPSSLSLSKPLKSILKHTSSPNQPNPLDPSATDGSATSTVALATMLESTIKHLAGNDRDSKVDAYTMLVRALKASTNLPDRIALQSKMGLFMQFIQRDITAKGENGAIDSSLINHSLTLLATFLHFPAIASTVTSDFGVFIIDHCIRSFEDPAMPKDVVRHLMQVVVCQEFSAKVMTADRVGRLVASLHRIEDHIKGKSIIMSRILIYRRLVRQSTLHMVAHSEWLQDLFTDMLSSMKEIRSAAIALGVDASFTVAKEKALFKKVVEILQMSVDETRYIEYYADRLTAMTQEKSEMAAVPQIWSVVILLLRCPIDTWDFFTRWLEIIQRCFNSGDFQTKLEANYAWNRLVYALYLYDSSFLKTIHTLCEPFNQLQRRGRQPDELRKVVVGGLCNLYYYAFKPNSTSERTTKLWDICVKPLIPKLAFPKPDGKPTESQQIPSSDNLSHAANILAGLFDPSSRPLWKEDHIAENALVKPTQLSPLDPKWIRRNTSRVFSLVEPILAESFLDLVDPESGASKLWRSLVGAVAAAASKEVKVATDTAAFLGHALKAYLNTMVIQIGHLPFTEKRLSTNKQNILVPVATPSHRSGKGTGPTRSPLYYLFSILSFLPPGISDGDEVSDLFRSIFGPFLNARSLRGKKDLVQELVQIPPFDEPVNAGPWIFIAGILSTRGDNNQSSYMSTDAASESSIGHDFRDMVRHLERGISHVPNLPWSQWLSLFNFVVGQATELSGEAGCSVAIIEPLAKALFEGLATKTDSTRPNLYDCGIQLVANARQPQDRQALDAAKRRLWGTTIAGVRSPSFDPFDNLYRLISHLLKASYATVDLVEEGTLASLITETSHFLTKSSQVLVFKSLVQLQESLGLWIQDQDERFGSKQRSTIAQAVKLLWDRICDLFSETTLEQFQLDAIEQLLCCAFKSKHRHIVNSAVLLWNRAFENSNRIEYPEALKDALLSLRQHVDIALPGLDVPAFDANNSALRFIDSQDDADFVASLDRVAPGANRDLGLLPTARHLETSSVEDTPQPSRTKSTHLQGRSHSRSDRSTRSTTRNSASKLRHDDSQLQFAVIEQSSPSKRILESQVLTDRQKEVRERQLGTAALFPSIRSSPEKDKQSSISGSHQSAPEQPKIIPSSVIDRSMTPKATRGFDYVVSSTPTPRRGQPSIIDEDHEMTDDVPSSPPEPRRNLLPEMKSHSRDTRMLDDMPLSSSPISGSPVSKIPLRPQRNQLESRRAVAGGNAEPTSSQCIDPRIHDSLATTPFTSSIALLTSSVETKRQPSPPEPGAEPVIQLPDTLANPRPSKAEGAPSSDTEVFVDAVTSPVVEQLPTSDRAVTSVQLVALGHGAFKDRSFEMSEMSDGEERSMARLVIELDSRKCDPLSSYDTSPEKAHGEKHKLECLTVIAGAEREGNYLPKTQSGPPAPISTSVHTFSDNSQSSGTRPKKRKRVSERKRNAGGKRRRRDSHGDEHPDNIISGPVLPANHEELPPTQSMESLEGEEQDHETPLMDQGSPDLSYNPGDESYIAPLDLNEDGMDSDTAAADLQLITEASQRSEVDYDPCSDAENDSEAPLSSDIDAMAQCDAKMEEINEPGPGGLGDAGKRTASQAPQSAVERITASLREGLEALRVATLSREDVYKIEDMFMDIKKELYEAERRSR
ncbi:putative telomere length regulator protein rif1 [Rosellinia necatrix]|uniref:Putative telomere length regulator protein rif1 n=1 Tax=Rosellinia necatrix TaxID=77044 RepID=A0A1W2TIZ3_ROSNE|nr:putative telomere length regulator protein rif1 [Rosellinia necatrix]